MVAVFAYGLWTIESVIDLYEPFAIENVQKIQIENH